MDLEQAVAAALAMPQPATIQILGGQWTKPRLPKRSRLNFILREGAEWKE